MPNCNECQIPVLTSSQGYNRDPQTGRKSRKVWCNSCYETLMARFSKVRLDEWRRDKDTEFQHSYNYHGYSP